MNTISIRYGRAADAERLASLHVSVWRATYKDYAPPEAIAILNEARRLPYWSEALASQGANSNVLVAALDKKILGAVSFAPAKHLAFEGRTEIKHLYVDMGAQGQGIGRRLLNAVLNRRELNHDSGIALAVVEQNKPARQFYETMGGVEIGSFLDPGPLWRSKNIVVVWD